MSKYRKVLVSSEFPDLKNGGFSCTKIRVQFHGLEVSRRSKTVEIDTQYNFGEETYSILLQQDGNV